MIYAWAWPTQAGRVNAWRDMVHENLGLIHTPSTLHVSRPGDIAYVNNSDEAQLVLPYKDRIKHVILGDERNVDGPSGKYEPPEVYNARLGSAYAILAQAGIPTSHKGLGMVRGQFDIGYMEKITIGDHRGVNTHPIHFNNAIRGLDLFPSEKFFVTLIPWRFWWTFAIGFVWQYFHRPGVRRQFEILKADPQVLGVGVWCLHEHKMGSRYNNQRQRWHGLIDWNDKLTWQGKLVRDLLSQ